MILGPYSLEDWRVMLCIEGALKYYLNRDPIRFQTAIRKDREMLGDYIRRSA